MPWKRGTDGTQERIGSEIYARICKCWKTSVEIKRILSQTPGSPSWTVVARVRQPACKLRWTRKNRPLRRQCVRRRGRGSSPNRWQRRDASHQGERLFDLVVRMKPEYRSSTREIGNLLLPTPSAASANLGACHIHREMGRHSFIARTIRDISACNSA